MMHIGHIKCLGVAALIAILIVLIVSIEGMYRSSMNDYLRTTDKCLSQAGDEELRMRIVSLGDKFKTWFVPYTDTSAYVNKTIEMEDTIIHIRIRKDDPTSTTKVRQFYFHLADWPLKIADVDSLFRGYMAENSLPVKTSYVEFLDLKKNILIDSNIPETKLSGYIASNIDTLDIMKTLGIKAYTKTPIFVILRPVMTTLILLAVFAVIAIACIVKLMVDILKLRQQGFRILHSMAKQTQHSLNRAAGEINEAAEEMIGLELIEEAEKFKAIYDRLCDASNQNRMLELLMDNDIGKLDFCETPVELEPLFYGLQDKYEHTAHKKVTVTVNVAPDLVLYIDEAFFISMMEELLVNAVKFSEKSVMIDLLATQDAKDTVITVRNTGWGIHPDEIEKVFDPSYKGLLHDQFLPDEMEGRGVGLTYIQSLMHSFGGKVSIQSEQNAFTEVKLIFPLTDDRKKAILAYKLIYRKMTSLN